MKSQRIFVSYSSTDKPFALMLVAQLREQGLEPWIDSEQIVAGDNILERLGEGLTKSDIVGVVVSGASLSSGWVSREVGFVAQRDMREKLVGIVPIAIDDTPLDALPWFLQTLNVSRVSADLKGAATAAAILKRVLERRFGQPSSEAEPATEIADPQIDQIIGKVSLGDHKAATFAALEIIKATDRRGNNELFQRLLRYRLLSDDDDRFWSAQLTIEHCAELMPSLVDRDVLWAMSTDGNFSVRSTAAAICMNLAQYAPDRVPVDIVFRLSVYDEDWYVEAPANAALKTMAASVPDVLSIYFSRLESAMREERAHAASGLFDIASKDPATLDRKELMGHVRRLKKIGDTDAVGYLEKAVHKLAAKPDPDGSARYKYGL